MAEAWNAAEESAAIYERLVEQLPEAFTDNLLGVLNTLAEVFDHLGRGDEAAKVRHRIGQFGKYE